ncbi:MAG: SLC13 family permease [Saprospiraceae bacterium]
MKMLFPPPGITLWRWILFLLAPVVATIIALFMDLEPGKPAVTYTLAVAVFMALWWVAEVVPLAVTSLLPIVFFPLFGIMNGAEVSSTYFNHIIFLFIGGFVVALAIQKWNLHRRIALYILKAVGTSPSRILLGFLIATGFLSMWISNLATTMLMLPIALSIIARLEDNNDPETVRHFAIGLLLVIAYSASIGGISTLVGTPPNLSFARIYQIYFPEREAVSFADWFFYAFPLSLMLFAFLYFFMKRLFVSKSRTWKSISGEQIRESYKALGPVNYEEKVLLISFCVLACLWFFRADIVIGDFRIPGWSNLFSNPKFFNDGTSAVFIAILLFLIPSKQQKGTFIMDWKTAEDIPWEIILLFGGGFALATGFKESGLAEWFGHQLEFLKGVHPLVLILCITTMLTFLTELTSNTATAETFLPIMASIAVSVDADPLLFMLPATVAASLAFMLPVATPPNAIIFGTRRLEVYHMARAGIALNFVGIFVVTLMTYFWGRLVFGL